MRENLKRLGLKYTINRVGGMLCLFFTEEPVVGFSSLESVDLERFSRYFWACLEGGVYLAPSQYECMFPSVAHTDTDIDKTLAVQYEALKGVH
jgi:glutamate-1-semialdehyde 2,1-aminomutase